MKPPLPEQFSLTDDIEYSMPDDAGQIVWRPGAIVALTDGNIYVRVKGVRRRLVFRRSDNRVRHPQNFGWM